MMQNKESAQSVKDLSNVIQINETQIQDHLGEMVRLTVEETLNAMLDAGADDLCQAKRYERGAGGADFYCGHDYLERSAVMFYASGGADLDLSNQVDLGDLAVLAESWLSN